MEFWETVFASAVGFSIANTIGPFINARLRKSNDLIQQRNADEIELKELCFEVRTLGTTYWSTQKNVEESKLLEAAINGRLTHLGQLVESLFENNSQYIDAANTELNRFHDALTGGEYGVTTRNEDFARCNRIEISCYSLRNKISRCKRKLSSPWFVNH